MPRRERAMDVLMAAAHELQRFGEPDFGEAELTVAAWSRDRWRFGLRGYAQTYPDHKRCYVETLRAVKAGLLVKTGVGRYRLA